MQNNAPNEKKKIFDEVESTIRHPIFEKFIIIFPIYNTL
jgi:hypothetical protein